MAHKCYHRFLELFDYRVRNGQEFGQVRCLECRTTWSMHAKHKAVTRFVEKLKANKQLPPG